jgi:hypothetical protein
MNERIKELKDRAWATCEEPEQYMDKFAELIVGECIGLCKDFRSTAAREFCELLREDIQEHFGLEVEE